MLAGIAVQCGWGAAQVSLQLPERTARFPVKVDPGTHCAKKRGQGELRGEQQRLWHKTRIHLDRLERAWSNN